MTELRAVYDAHLDAMRQDQMLPCTISPRGPHCKCLICAWPSEIGKINKTTGANKAVNTFAETLSKHCRESLREEYLADPLALRCVGSWGERVIGRVFIAGQCLANVCANEGQAVEWVSDFIGHAFACDRPLQNIPFMLFFHAGFAFQVKEVTHTNHSQLKRMASAISSALLVFMDSFWKKWGSCDSQTSADVGACLLAIKVFRNVFCDNAPRGRSIRLLPFQGIAPQTPSHRHVLHHDNLTYIKLEQTRIISTSFAKGDDPKQFADALIASCELQVLICQIHTLIPRFFSIAADDHFMAVCDPAEELSNIIRSAFFFGSGFDEDADSLPDPLSHNDDIRRTRLKLSHAQTVTRFIMLGARFRALIAAQPSTDKRFISLQRLAQVSV